MGCLSKYFNLKFTKMNTLLERTERTNGTNIFFHKFLGYNNKYVSKIELINLLDPKKYLKFLQYCQ